MSHHKHALSGWVFGHNRPLPARMVIGAALILAGVLIVHAVEHQILRYLTETLGALLQGMGVTPFIDKFVEWASEAD